MIFTISDHFGIDTLRSSTKLQRKPWATSMIMRTAQIDHRYRKFHDDYIAKLIDHFLT